MWLIKTALSRPYTFIVLALLILIASPIVILRTPTDIFPKHRYPRYRDCLELQWPESGGNGRAADVGF